jgi:hypothetical protein
VHACVHAHACTHTQCMYICMFVILYNSVTLHARKQFNIDVNLIVTMIMCQLVQRHPCVLCQLSSPLILIGTVCKFCCCITYLLNNLRHKCTFFLTLLDKHNFISVYL